MSSDGDVEDVVVHQLDGCDITASLDDDSFDVITDQCYEHYEALVKAANDDLAIERSLTAREYQECM